MDFQHSERARVWAERLDRFIEERVKPRAAEYAAAIHADPDTQPAVMETMKAEARDAGLWNLFLPGEAHDGYGGAGLTNLEYAPLAERMAKVGLWCPEVFNCNAPDTAAPAMATPAIQNITVGLAWNTSRRKAAPIA